MKEVGWRLAVDVRHQPENVEDEFVLKRKESTMMILTSLSILSLIGSVMMSTVDPVELSSFYIFEVPYVSQDSAYWCGPASLAMVFGYWGLNLTQEEIAAEIYDPQARLTNISAMGSYPQEYGFRTEELNGSIGYLRKWISKGCPTIVLQEVSRQNKYGHYRVVLGYNDEQEIMTTFDPIFGSNYNTNYTEFAELWKPGTTFQTCNWTLLTIPQNSLLTSQAEKKQLYLNQKAPSTQQPLKPNQGYLIAICLILASLGALLYSAKARPDPSKKNMQTPPPQPSSS